MWHLLEGAFFPPKAVSQVSESSAAMGVIQRTFPNFSSLWQLQPPLSGRAVPAPSGGLWLAGGSLWLSVLDGPADSSAACGHMLPAAVLCCVGGFA